MGLPATRKTATVGDRGEDNKDPDWLIGQSIVRQVAGGVVTLRNGDWKLLQSLQKVKLSSTSCNAARNKNAARQVAEVTCYTVQFFSNLCRNGVAQCNTAFSNAIFSRFCVYCFYEAVDSIPSPEFHRSFASGRTIRVNFSDANGSTDLRWIQSAQCRNIIQSQQGYEICLLCLRRSCELFFSMAYGTRYFQHSIRKAATKRWLTISPDVRRLCKLLANWEFALHGVRNSRFLTFNRNSRKKETTTHDRPCELLVNCEGCC